MKLTTIIKSAINLSTVIVLIVITIYREDLAFKFVVLVSFITIVWVFFAKNNTILRKLLEHSLGILGVLYTFLIIYVLTKSPIINVDKFIHNSVISAIVIASYEPGIFLSKFFRFDTTKKLQEVTTVAFFYWIGLISGVSLLLVLSIYRLFKLPIY